MAASHELTDILGALVPGDGRLRFCRSTLDELQPGDWVELIGTDGPEPARIVFGPGQVEYPTAPAELPRIERRLTADEIAGLAPVEHPAPPEADRYGSLGRLHPRIADPDAYIRMRLRLGRAPELPALGAIVQTDHGPGVLLGISMRHQSATIRLESGDEVRVAVEALWSED